MADSGNSKALSAHSNNASSPSSHLNSKKSANSKTPASPSKLNSSPAKSSNTKQSQPIKPGTPKSILKSATSSNSLAQKSSPIKTSSPVNNKRAIPSVDLKNTPELKQTSNETSGKKVSVKVPQHSIVENMKSKSCSVEKLPEAAVVSKTIVSKVVPSRLSSEVDRINELKKTVNPTPNNVDPSEVIELLESVTANMESLGGEFRVSKCTSGCDQEEISETASSDKNAFSDKNNSELKLSDKFKIKSEEEEDFIIVYPGEDVETKVDSAEPSDINHIDLDQRSLHFLNKTDTVIGTSFFVKKDDDNVISYQKEIKSPDSFNCVTGPDLAGTTLSATIDCNNFKNINVLESLASESALMFDPVDSVLVKSHDNILLQQDFLNEKNVPKLSGGYNDNSVSNPTYEVSSNGFPIDTACNLASGYVNISNQPSVIDSNDNSTNKDVSDPISTNGLVTKPCDTSEIDDPKVNGEIIIKSNPSQKSIDCPSDNSQVSPQEEISTKEESTPAPPPEETKQSIRLKVWDILEKKNCVLYPRPCKGRIPHFVGSPEAAERLATLDDFKNARNVKVNPDKPQSHVRFLSLEAGKNLLVPVPRLRSGLFKRFVPHPGATKEQLKTMVSYQEIFNSAQEVKLSDKVSIDLVVMGAVAVSKEGYRIGKGEGYADLEFAIMMKMGAITQDTVVITTVHDEQVFDTLPHHLFKEHDVPVDFIVTPNNVYEVTPRLPKPSGIFWNILSNRRLQLIPILKTLRDQEIGEGNECKLKEVDSDPEDRPVRPYKYFNRIRRTHRDQIKPRNQKPPRENSAPPPISNMRPPQRGRQTRTFRRKQAVTRSSSAKEQPIGNAESGNNSKKKQQNMVERVRAGGDGVQPMRRRYFHKPRAPIAFSVRVSGISRGTRIRDLKTALNERGVKPYDISWVHKKGQAVLHFSRMEMFKDKKPQVLSELPTIDVVEGFPAKLELKLMTDAKSCKYNWSVNGKPIDLVGRTKIISRVDGTAGLLINNVNFEDAGEYTVTVRNRHGEITCNGALNVIAKAKANTPEVKPSFVGDEVIVQELSADRNMPLLISLSISGNPVPDIEWSKDNNTLRPTHKIQFLCDGNKVGLRINECRMSDAGEYKCKLRNHLGEAEFATKVIINPPSKSIDQVNNIAKIVSLQDITLAMDNIIASLQNLKVKGEGEEEPQESLSVKPVSSISRIESTGMSAV